MIFCPAKHTGRQIKELDLSIFDLITGNPGETNLLSFLYGDKKYSANIGSVRHHVLKNNPVCCCCGLKITRCFLETDADDIYHIQFYAESGRVDGPSHLILMTQDHIIAKFNDGSESISNSQTLCYNCNNVKGVTDFTINQIKSILFPAYRSYKSSVILRKAKELVAPLRLKISGNFKTINAITKALEIVHDERVVSMKEKILQRQIENDELSRKCDQIEFDAQVKGICPSEI
jgi:5-methylcytosine-specific restriction endonuclease McrA